jgi:antitoxin VapB
MALFIRDDEVDALAAELQKVTKAATKKDAVRLALRNELERSRRKRALLPFVEELQEKIAALGPSDPEFDMKRFSDEMWGDA